MPRGYEVAGQDEGFLREWVASVDPAATLTLEPPGDARSGHGVSAYLLEIAPGAPPRGSTRPPLQLWLRYLVTTWADDPVVARRLLMDLAFAALSQADLDVAPEPLAPDLWTRPRRGPPAVLHPARRRPSGATRGRRAARAAARSSSNRPGSCRSRASSSAPTSSASPAPRSTWSASTAGRAPTAVAGSASAACPATRSPAGCASGPRGWRSSSRVPADPQLARTMVIHLDPLEGEHGRTAHA